MNTTLSKQCSDYIRRLPLCFGSPSCLCWGALSSSLSSVRVLVFALSCSPLVRRNALSLTLSRALSLSLSFSLAYCLAASLHLSLSRSLAIVFSLARLLPHFFSPSVSPYFPLSSLPCSVSLSRSVAHFFSPSLTHMLSRYGSFSLSLANSSSPLFLPLSVSHHLSLQATPLRWILAISVEALDIRRARGGEGLRSCAPPEVRNFGCRTPLGSPELPSLRSDFLGCLCGHPPANDRVAWHHKKHVFSNRGRINTQGALACALTYSDRV